MLQKGEISWFGEGVGAALTLARPGQLETLSFTELKHQADRLAAQFTSAHVAPGDLVAVGISDVFTTVRLVYGLLRHGSALLPFAETMGTSMRNQLLELADCRTVVTLDPLDDLPQSARSLSYSQLPAVPAAGSATRVSASYLRLIVSTSGSTGVPKGVMLTEANLWASAIASNRRLGLEPGDRWLNVLPLRHIGGLSIVYRCLQARAEMVLMASFDAIEIWRQICECGITHLSLVPTMLLRLLDVSQGSPPPENFRVALVGGAALSMALADRALVQGWPLCVTYGMSEAASQVACECAPRAGATAGFVGQPLDEVSVRVNAHGRIEVAGPSVMVGYLNPEKTWGRGLNEGWFETGDLGRIDRQGGVHILGRADSMLTCGGINVYPVQVERRLLTCPEVDQAVIIGKADEEWGSLLCAIYTGEIKSDDLQLWARSNLSGAECPKRFIRVESLPYDAMGKLNQKSLQDLLQ